MQQWWYIRLTTFTFTCFYLREFGCRFSFVFLFFIFVVEPKIGEFEVAKQY